MVAFQEVFRRSGIDERRSPPGMVVPFGGANIVALIDPGRKLKVDPNAHALEIKEIDGAEIRKRLMQVSDTFSEPIFRDQGKEEADWLSRPGGGGPVGRPEDRSQAPCRRAARNQD